jgi:hypothetical protein
MVVTRTAHRRMLRRQEPTDPFPLGLGEFDTRRRRDEARETRCDSFSGSASAVAALSNRLMGLTPAGPVEVEESLCVIHDGGEHEAADLRDTQRDKRRAGAGSPV